MIASKAIQRELLKYQDDDDLKFAVEAEGDDLTNLRITLTPPENTPYEDGVFFLKVTIPPQYPSSPPNIQFETKIYHPNITEEGQICLGQLKADWKRLCIRKDSKRMDRKICNLI